MLKCCLHTSHLQFVDENLKCHVCVGAICVNKSSLTFSALECVEGGGGGGGGDFFFFFSNATAVSNLPAIFFWASKAPKMTATSHMGFLTQLWGLITRASKPSSRFRASISPELVSALHPKFLLTPTFKVYFTAAY